MPPLDKTYKWYINDNNNIDNNEIYLENKYNNKKNLTETKIKY